VAAGVPFSVACRSEQAEQAMCDLSDFAGQAGRGQVKAKRDADQRMPYAQARIPAQQNYQHTQRGNERDRKRQLITSLHLSMGRIAMSAPVNHRGMPATPCGVTRSKPEKNARISAPVRKTAGALALAYAS